MVKVDSFGVYIPALTNTARKLSSLVETMVNDGTVERLNGDGTIGPFAVTLVRKEALDNRPSTREGSSVSVNDVLEIMLTRYRRALIQLVSDKPKNMRIQGFSTHKNAVNLSMTVELDPITIRNIQALRKTFTQLGSPGVVMPNNALHLSLAKFSEELKEPKDKIKAIKRAESIVRRRRIYGNSCSLGGLVIGATYDSPHPDYEEFLEKHKIAR